MHTAVRHCSWSSHATHGGLSLASISQPRSQAASVPPPPPPPPPPAAGSVVLLCCRLTGTTTTASCPQCIYIGIFALLFMYIYGNENTPSSSLHRLCPWVLSPLSTADVGVATSSHPPQPFLLSSIHHSLSCCRPSTTAFPVVVRTHVAPAAARRGLIVINIVAQLSSVLQPSGTTTRSASATSPAR